MTHPLVTLTTSRAAHVPDLRTHWEAAPRAAVARAARRLRRHERELLTTSGAAHVPDLRTH